VKAAVVDAPLYKVNGLGGRGGGLVVDILVDINLFVCSFVLSFVVNDL
jgi:hypothetical protein